MTGDGSYAWVTSRAPPPVVATVVAEVPDPAMTIGDGVRLRLPVHSLAQPEKLVVSEDRRALTPKPSQRQPGAVA